MFLYLLLLILQLYKHNTAHLHYGFIVNFFLYPFFTIFYNFTIVVLHFQKSNAHAQSLKLASHHPIISSNVIVVDFHPAMPSSNPHLGTLRIKKDAHATYHSIFVVLCDSKDT